MEEDLEALRREILTEYEKAKKGDENSRKRLHELMKRAYTIKYGDQPPESRYTPPPPIQLGIRKPHIRRNASRVLEELRKRLLGLGTIVKKVSDLEKVIRYLEGDTKDQIERLYESLPPEGYITALEVAEHVEKDPVKFLRVRELVNDCTSPRKENFFDHTLPYYFAPEAHTVVVRGKILRYKGSSGRRGGKEKVSEERKPVFVIYYSVGSTPEGKRVLYLNGIQPTKHARFFDIRGKRPWMARWVVPHLVNLVEEIARIHGAEEIHVPITVLSNEYYLAEEIRTELERRGAKYSPRVRVKFEALPSTHLDSPHFLLRMYRTLANSYGEKVPEKPFMVYKI